MTDSAALTKHLELFFVRHLPVGSAFVLGCSGGVDSTALLHLIYGLSRFDLHCHVVHVDHGWRKESADEAMVLEERVRALGFSFSSYRLHSCPKGENVEDWCRCQRLDCFKAAAHAIGSSVALVAHQADDQIEVVLKRFLEGSSLTKFRGMRAVEHHEGLTIMRPLLDVRRADLLAYLEEKGLPYFDDPTNRDSAFLRGRMREVMIPMLRQSFGKNFDRSLLRVADEASDLDRFVVEECERRCTRVAYPGVAFASVNEALSPFLAYHLIDAVGRQAKLPSCSRSQRMAAGRALCGRLNGPKRWYIGEGGFYVEKGEVAAFACRPPCVEITRVEAAEGSCRCGQWHIAWHRAPSRLAQQWGWQELFSGDSF